MKRSPLGPATANRLRTRRHARSQADLADGAYKLIVQSDGNPDVSADFTVARNAPGLYNTVVDGLAFGLFLHENGDPITSDSPAHRDETVTLLGTGFGPLLQMAPEGFPVAESDTSVLGGSAHDRGRP